MPFSNLRESLITRLDEGGSGAKGWFLITRVHLNASRLQQLATYLHDAGAAEPLELTAHHYGELGNLLNIGNANPDQTINRHYFLAMETPLGLLKRVSPPHWRTIQLTQDGVKLGTEETSSALLEKRLRAIRFCRQPWFTASRVVKYGEFDVEPYSAVLAVMAGRDGYIDLDEFDLFVSRIRNDGEIGSVIASIAEFRQLAEREKAQLRREVEIRTPAGGGANPQKTYSNWRDTGRHTFSLFSLGQSAHRAGNELWLTERMAAPELRPPPGHQPREQLPRQRAPATLRLPETNAPAELLVPPGAVEANTGSEAELLVGKILASAEWQVVYYSKRRGYGFDLWARKGERAFVIEVKSSLGLVGSVTLTAMEYEAAQHHGDNYLLVVVDGVDSQTSNIHVIQNPAATVTFTERNKSEYSANRAAWLPAAAQAFPN